jgi:shikimate kinase
VALVGFMGCGKSTVGALLAARLGCRFVDLDALIEQRAGKPIHRIFEEQGEEAFRELESRALRELGERGGAPARGGGLVLAAGGGAPLDPENRRWFREQARTFYLEISFDTFVTRTGTDPRRPLLRRSVEELRRLYDGRLSAYREAGTVIDAEALSPEQIAAEIQRRLADQAA